MQSHTTRLRLNPATLALCLGMLAVGCVNLDRQTVATKAPIKKTPEAMLAATKKKSNSFVERMKSVLPKQPRKQIADQPVAENDPTRLDAGTKPIGPELYIAAARLSERSGRYDVALEQYDLALKADGTNRNALIGLARLQHRTGKVEEAIRIYRDALNIYRDDAVIMNDLGLCYVREARLGEAISMLQAAVQAAPEREMYLNNLAAALVEANRTGEAMAHLSRVHGPAVANYKVGMLMGRAGKQQQSVEFLNQALALDPNLQAARDLLARNSPRVSSLPLRNSNLQGGTYEIPASKPAANGLQLPNRSLPSQGDLAPSTPAENVPHLKNAPERIGPFGFVPVADPPQVQLVAYVEEVVDESSSLTPTD